MDVSGICDTEQDLIGQKRVVEINCQAAEVAEIENLTEFQGDLKKLSDKNYNKFKSNILQYGIISPLHIWISEEHNSNFVLDGHQRIRTLARMRREGYVVPPIPVVFIQAKNMQDAKEQVVALSSQYGEASIDSFEKYIISYDLDINKFKDFAAIPNIDIDKMIKNAEKLAKETLEKVNNNVEESLASNDKLSASHLVHTCPNCGHKFGKKK